MFAAIMFFAALVNISWAAPTGGPTPTGYKIYIGPTSTNKPTVVDAGNVLTKQVDIDLTQAKYIVVRAYNSFGESADSNEVVVGKPSAPANLTVTP